MKIHLEFGENKEKREKKLFEIHKNIYSMLQKKKHLKLRWGRRGRDRMVVGFTTTYAISTNNH